MHNYVKERFAKATITDGLYSGLVRQIVQETMSKLPRILGPDGPGTWLRVPALPPRPASLLRCH